jgi:hypothetical protein
MRNVIIASCALALVVASGCGIGGPKLVPVNGKLTNGGKSPLPDPKGGLTIVFLPTDPNAKKATYPATPFNQDDNSFTVPGPDGKGIPAGKYKVTINMMVPGSSPVADKINEKYTAEKTPIEIDVTGEPVDIDLSKYAK